MKTMNLLSTLLLFTVLLGCQPAAETTKKTETSPETAVQPAPAMVAEVKPACQLSLGFESWEPYQFVDRDQKPAGLDIELVQAVAAKMNCTLSYRQGTWVELITAVRAGEVDMLLGASMTEARNEFAYFSQSYRKEQFVLYIRALDAAALPHESVRDFLAAGKKIGVVSEYYYGPELSELYGNDQYKDQFVEAPLSELNMVRLLDDEIDGMLEDKFVAASMLRRKGMEKDIAPHPITLGDNDVFVMFSKKSVTADQVASFDAAMAEIRANGEYDAVIQRYNH